MTAVASSKEWSRTASLVITRKVTSFGSPSSESSLSKGDPEVSLSRVCATKVSAKPNHLFMYLGRLDKRIKLVNVA